MGIPMNTLCIKCLLNKHIDNARSLGTEEQANAFVGDIFRLFSNQQEWNSSMMGMHINELYVRHYGLPHDRFREEKKRSNEYVKERLPRIRQKVQKSEDPIYTALQYAIMGNYIDFSALGKNVSFDALEQMLEQPEKFELDRAVYLQFREELDRAEKMLYITDNAGEIGFDLLLAEELQKYYVNLKITFCVRGKPALNDAMREDAAFMELPFPIIDNGNGVGGTELSLCNQQTLDALSDAHVVLAKGMGNTETLYGCGHHIFYAFLVKCPRFMQFFQKPFMTTMFIREGQDQVCGAM